jgi:hypothetical protein
MVVRRREVAGKTKDEKEMPSQINLSSDGISLSLDFPCSLCSDRILSGGQEFECECTCPVQQRYDRSEAKKDKDQR